MKTSVLEVHDMLSVLSVDELEKQIGEVPGVESTTVNFAAKSATVRYDETRLEISDIKSAVRQRAYASPSHSGATDGQKDHAAPSATPRSTAPTPAPNAPGIAGPATTSQDKAVPSAPKPPASPPHAAAAPAYAPLKSPPGAVAPAASGGHDHSDKEPPKKA